MCSLTRSSMHPLVASTPAHPRRGGWNREGGRNTAFAARGLYLLPQGYLATPPSVKPSRDGTRAQLKDEEQQLSSTRSAWGIAYQHQQQCERGARSTVCALEGTAQDTPCQQLPTSDAVWRCGHGVTNMSVWSTRSAWRSVPHGTPNSTERSFRRKSRAASETPTPPPGTTSQAGAHRASRSHAN